jgi:hypothetical protein
MLTALSTCGQVHWRWLALETKMGMRFSRHADPPSPKRTPMPMSRSQLSPTKACMDATVGPGVHYRPIADISAYGP